MAQRLLPTFVSWALSLPLIAAGWITSAQTYEIRDSILGTAPLPVAGEGFSVSAKTVPAPETVMTGGDFDLAGGVLGVTVIVQTLGPPSLTLARFGTDLVLSWSLSDESVLQEADAIGSSPSSTAWRTTDRIVSIEGDQNRVLVTPIDGARFFRLIRVGSDLQL